MMNTLQYNLQITVPPYFSAINTEIPESQFELNIPTKDFIPFLCWSKIQ